MGSLGHQGDDRVVEVDQGLEERLVAVESAVVTYLVRITETSRSDLISALEDVDAKTAAGDAFRSRTNALVTLTGMAGLGSSSLGVIGQMSRFPVVSQIPAPILRAQAALVRVAKEEVADGSPRSLEALDAASRELAAARRRYLR